jgi:hypothetical protein
MESAMSPIQVGEGVEATPEMIATAEGRYFLPGERVRLLPGTQLSDESAADAAHRRAGFPRDAELVVSATWIVRGADGEARVAYAIDGHAGLHAANAFGDPRNHVFVYGLMIHRGGSIFLVPFDERAELVVDASGPPVRIAERLGRSARHAFGLGGESDEAALFFAGLERAPLLGEFHILENGDGTSDLAYAPWWTEGSPGEVAVAQSAIASAGFDSAPAVRN